MILDRDEAGHLMAEAAVDRSCKCKRLEMGKGGAGEAFLSYFNA